MGPMKCSLPDRQLRKGGNAVHVDDARSLPDRQRTQSFRNSWADFRMRNQALARVRNILQKRFGDPVAGTFGLFNPGGKDFIVLFQTEQQTFHQVGALSRGQLQRGGFNLFKWGTNHGANLHLSLGNANPRKLPTPLAMPTQWPPSPSTQSSLTLQRWCFCSRQLAISISSRCLPRS